MNHQTYVAERIARDPRFADERKASAAELALGEALVRRRLERAMSIVDMSAATAIPEARLDEIEAGESPTLHEVLWLVHALEMNISISPGFSVFSMPSTSENQAAGVTGTASHPDRQRKAASA